ncbi:hypothetical protein [Ferruginibacter sp. SUN106]|uniref:hypothetical protein n=1 Tax=Ferruginibacter sp. SUN106 TaxID=2978348 RepID=UPI003D36FED4
MNEQLALEILKTIQKGESNGYQTIKNDVLNMPSFHELTENDFKVVFDKLLENQCIVTFRDINTNNLRSFKLNNTKDCISIYQNKATAALNELEKTKEKDNLTVQQLRTQVMLLTEQLADFPRMKRQRRNAIIVAIFAISATIILGVLNYSKK